MAKKIVTAVKPAEVVNLKKSTIPAEVLEAFNSLIAENLQNGEARVVQNEVVKILVEKGLNREEIFKKGWLNVEEIYMNAGWRVGYDKPGYNESYEAFFIFKAKQ
ncbi:MAG: hypothetical protein JWN50_2 [Parcubacteria group bacterium]|nr:hypothetical protein [Parcubacteria group bacterium]